VRGKISFFSLAILIILLFSQILASKKVISGPWNRGSADGNNNCFLNASMQALSHTKPLFDILKNAKDFNMISKNSIADYVSQYFEELHDKEKPDAAASTKFRQKITSSEINDQPNNTLKKLSGSGQHDADELIRGIIDKISEDIGEIKDIFDLKIVKLLRCFAIHLSPKMAFINYTAKSFKDSEEPYNGISLPITENPEIIKSKEPKIKKTDYFTTLDGCLDYYFSFPEQYDYDLTTKTPTRIVSCSRITKLPEILMICLKRYKASSEKIKKDIDVPVELKIKNDWLILAEKEQQEITYDLFSVVFHDGSTITSGHYIAWAKNPENAEWYEYDDKNVTKKTVNDKINNISESRTVYVVFYQISEKSKKIVTSYNTEEYKKKLKYPQDSDKLPYPLDPTKEEIEKTINTLNKERQKLGLSEYPMPPVKAPDPLQTALALLKAKLLSLAKTLKAEA